MILYDSHKWWTLCKIHGSIFPRAMLLALPSALLALGLKYMEIMGLLDLSRLEVLSEGSIYSGFTYVLGFSLVFRTTKSYERYWMGATNIHEMSSRWSDACASIIAFSTLSKSPREELHVFTHTLVRLFSLLHAVALEEVSSGEDHHFPLIDVKGFAEKDLSLLAAEVALGKKMDVILCWIKVYVIQCMDSGLLSVPAPILTRVFQEFGSGLTSYHKAQQVAIWPFPFPYTQLNLTLLYIYTIFTPLVICTWDAPPWICCLFTFISVICMIGLDLIALELENPFGDDPNDLPGFEMQDAFNRGLLLMLYPDCWRPPQLRQTAACNESMLQQSYVGTGDSMKQLGRSKTTKLDMQRQWASQGRTRSRGVRHWLRASRRLRSSRRGPDEAEAKQRSSPEGPHGPLAQDFSTETTDAKPSVSRMTSGTLRQGQLSADFFSVLAQQLEEQMQRQLQHQDAVLCRQLAAHEQFLSDWSGWVSRSCSARSPPRGLSAGKGASHQGQPWDKFLEALTQQLQQQLQRQLQHQDAALRQQLAAYQQVLAGVSVPAGPHVAEAEGVSEPRPPAAPADLRLPFADLPQVASAARGALGDEVTATPAPMSRFRKEVLLQASAARARTELAAVGARAPWSA